MAAIESKRSKQKKAISTQQSALSQSRNKGKTKKAISNQQLAISQSKTEDKTTTPTKSKSQTKPAINPRKRRFPALPKPKVSKAGKTTITRFPHGSRFYRFEEVKGKSVDFVQFFTVSDYHSIDVRFQDKTTLHFVIEPGFTLETQYSSLKTGNWHCVKKWPEIRSTPLNG